MLESSEVPLARADFSAPFQLGTSHATPVKLLRCKPLRAHRRHGVPVRSSALRLALINPVLALGPNLGFAVPVLAGLALWSIVPSSSLGFFFGPGLPLGLGIPSDGIGVDRFTPFTLAGCFLDAPPGEGASIIGAGVDGASELTS